jgi:hypothetical protein
LFRAQQESASAPAKFRRNSGTASTVLALQTTYIVEKEALRAKELEHVLIEKVEQVFRNML